MNYPHKKWTALICATAIWFSFIASHSVQGAQIEPRNGSSLQPAATLTDNPLSQNALPADASIQSGFDWGSVATIAVSAGVLLLGYNLLTSRKHGWAWFLICTVGVVIGFIGKVSASMFCEISSDATGISDWDSDD
jgi:hypothetical protein